MLISAFASAYTHARERPGTICKKDRELSGGFNREFRMWIHAAFKVMQGTASDNSRKSGDVTLRSF